MALSSHSIHSSLPWWLRICFQWNWGKFFCWEVLRFFRWQWSWMLICAPISWIILIGFLPSQGRCLQCPRYGVNRDIVLKALLQEWMWLGTRCMNWYIHGYWGMSLSWLFLTTEPKVMSGKVFRTSDLFIYYISLYLIFYRNYDQEFSSNDFWCSFINLVIKIVYIDLNCLVILMTNFILCLSFYLWLGCFMLHRRSLNRKDSLDKFIPVKQNFYSPFPQNTL